VGVANRSKLARIAVVVAWIGGVAIAFGAVWRTERVTAAAPRPWPADSALSPAPGMNVVLVVDPAAPATRAKLTELARLAATRADVQVHVVIEGDAGTAAERTAIARATEIRGARVFVDHQGVEAGKLDPSWPSSPPAPSSVPLWRTSTDSGPKLVENVNRAASW
jgi:hypothetical protein